MQAEDQLGSLYVLDAVCGERKANTDQPLSVVRNKSCWRRHPRSLQNRGGVRDALLNWSQSQAEVQGLSFERGEGGVEYGSDNGAESGSCKDPLHLN